MEVPMGALNRIIALGSILLALGAPPSLAEEWPQFRGLNGSGVSPSKGLPTQFSATDRVRWQATLGDGIASPVISGGRVYCTAFAGGKLVVSALDAATGQRLWQKAVDPGPLPRITAPNSHASSTPATDGKRVYVYFSTIGLLAFDARTGADAWRLRLPKPAYLMDWGAGASPIVYKDRVFFCQDDDLAPFVVAVDSASGEVRWRVARPDMLAGYAMPVICEAGGRTDLVVAGTGKLKGYDPDTGQERWTCNTLLRTVMTSPVVDQGVIYIAVQSYGDSKRTLKFALLEWLDTNQDGKLIRAEVPKEFHERFDTSDKNRDGVLTEGELDTAFQHPNNMVGGGTIVQAVRGGGSGDVTKTHLLWNLTNRAPSNLVSPLVVNGRVHTVKAGGLSSCFDAKTGQTLWELQRLQNLGDYYASPVAADGKIFIAGKNGFVVVLKDSPALEILARNDMGEEILATPSIADGRLFVRTRNKLVCIGATPSAGNR
jgi:outer membrane protein assembly factor BamB